jgi:hypothetical protein
MRSISLNVKNVIPKIGSAGRQGQRNETKQGLPQTCPLIQNTSRTGRSKN